MIAWMAAAAVAAAQDFSDLATTNRPLWGMDRDAFVEAFGGRGLRWDAEDKSSARVTGGLVFLGIDAQEAVVRFGTNGRPTDVAVILYNRGDSGELAKDAFLAMVTNASAQLRQWGGSNPQRATDELRTSGVKRDALLWIKTPHRLRLAWSYSTRDTEGHVAFRSEYVKVEIAPQTAVPIATGTRNPAALKQRVKSFPNGDLSLEGVPMVDQGEKGYCAVATSARVMRYYGIDLDEHELAQLAASTGDGGTSAQVLVSALKRVGAKVGCRTRVLYEIDVKEIQQIVDRYNRFAKKSKLPKIELGLQIDMDEVYRRFDSGTLKASRIDAAGDFKRFQFDIKAAITEGVPLEWSVYLGKVEESVQIPQAGGGHMRLIIGVNERAGEVIYTDSWGAGHERKRMRMDDAWTITTGLLLIEPRPGGS
jgi:hypothetical protein